MIWLEFIAWFIRMSAFHIHLYKMMNNSAESRYMFTFVIRVRYSCEYVRWIGAQRTRIHQRLLNVEISFYYQRCHYKYIYKTRKFVRIYHLIILISTSVRNRLKSSINFDVIWVHRYIFKQLFCISHLKVAILPQDSLKIKLKNFFKS